MEWIFWGAVVFVLYAYAGYFLSRWALSLVRNRPVLSGIVYPRVSFIITAFNEETRIREKIDNSLQQAYPRERLEIVVASDCSTDKTDEIVLSYAGQGVRLIRASERKGKEAAQKLAVAQTSGDVLVFSDVATRLSPDGIATIVKSFHDPSVGCVSSVDRFVDADGKMSGEGAYVRYEMALRSLESRVNSLVGLSGSFFAARREVCSPWAEDLQSDFNTLLNSVKRGLRGVSDSASIGYYKNISDERREYQRKVRTILRGIAVLMRSLPLLNPFKHGLFAWQLFSHKLCRWLVPFAMIIAFVANGILAIDSGGYRLLWSCQVLLYVGTLAYVQIERFPLRHALKLPAFFVLVNVSILDAWIRFLKGERIFRWDPSRR